MIGGSLEALFLARDGGPEAFDLALASSAYHTQELVKVGCAALPAVLGLDLAIERALGPCSYGEGLALLRPLRSWIEGRPADLAAAGAAEEQVKDDEVLVGDDDIGPAAAVEADEEEERGTVVVQAEAQ